MNRREFLKLTAAAPAVGLISASTGSLRTEGNAVKGELLTECLAGSIEFTAPGLSMYGSRHSFCEELPFMSNWIRLEAVPKFKCYNQPGSGNTYYEKNGEEFPVNSLLDLSLGAAGSEVSYITHLHLRKGNQYVIPFAISKGSRVTLRIEDAIHVPTKYKLHMMITGASE